MLYQLLTGRLPFDLRSRHPGVMVEVILEEAPRPPSEVDYPEGWPLPLNAASGADADPMASGFRRLLKDNVDEIVLKALDRKPEHRHRSASELAEVIEATL